MKNLVLMVACATLFAGCKVKQDKDSESDSSSSRAQVSPIPYDPSPTPTPTPIPTPTPEPIPTPVSGSSEGYLEYNGAAYTWYSDDDGEINDCWVDHDPTIWDLGLNPYGPYKKLQIMIHNSTGPTFEIQSYYYFRDLLRYIYYQATVTFTGYFAYNRIDVYGSDGTWGSASAGTGRPTSSSCSYSVRKVDNRVEGSFDCVDLYKMSNLIPLASSPRNANGRYNCEIRPTYRNQ